MFSSLQAYNNAEHWVQSFKLVRKIVGGVDYKGVREIMKNCIEKASLLPQGSNKWKIFSIKRYFFLTHENCQVSVVVWQLSVRVWEVFLDIFSTGTLLCCRDTSLSTRFSRVTRRTRPGLTGASSRWSQTSSTHSALVNTHKWSGKLARQNVWIFDRRGDPK